MPLNDRARIILFWFTIALMLAVAIVAAITILRACGGLPARGEPPLAITPAEVSLCPGDQQQFALADDLEVTWDASGGTVNEEGVYTAGDTPGDYTVSATRAESGRAAGSIVHIIACTPTPTVTPPPTIAPTATSEPTATPEPGEPTEPTEPAEPSSTNPDPQGDVGTYDAGAPVEEMPTGVDIAAASVNADLGLSLQPTAEPPEELTDWSEEGEAFFWISLYDAVPEPPLSYMNWLFVIDTDGNTETGRPVGSRRINPDLGDEVAVGVSYDANTEAYEPYSLVWDTEAGTWATGPEVRYTFVQSRTVVGLALSVEALEETIAEAEAAPISPGAVKGRAAAETYLADGTRVIDFYPNLSE